MRKPRKSMWLAAVAASGLVVPPSAWSEGEKQTEVRKASAETSEQAPKMRDVALSREGTFAGRVLDDQGRALDGVVVTLVRRGDETGKETTTDAQGRFKFASMKGGIYQVQTPQSQNWYRVWSADSAPEQAMKTVVMSSTGPVMRAQFGFLDPANTTAILLGAGGVALSAITLVKVNDLQDDVDKIPTSP